MTGTHFDLIAEDYDESLPPHVIEHYLRKRTRFVLERCPGSSGLDVGCGTGVLAGRLAAAGYAMTGVDPSEGMLGVMRARVPGVMAVHGTGTALPFPAESFDVVLCVAVMHHVADPEDVHRTVAEMVRVAKPAGRVVIWDHNPRNPYWRNLMARVPQDTGEERLIPEEELIGALDDAGAHVVSSEQLGLVPDFVPPALLPIAAAVERGAERMPGLRRLCAHNVIVAAKRRAHTPSRPA